MTVPQPLQRQIVFVKRLLIQSVSKRCRSIWAPAAEWAHENVCLLHLDHVRVFLSSEEVILMMQIYEKAIWNGCSLYYSEQMLQLKYWMLSKLPLFWEMKVCLHRHVEIWTLNSNVVAVANKGKQPVLFKPCLRLIFPTKLAATRLLGHSPTRPRLHAMVNIYAAPIQA